MAGQHDRSWEHWLLAFGLVPLLVLYVLVVVPIIVLYRLTLYVGVHVGMWLWWAPRGIDVLLVYSNSPTWQQYFEEEVLPRLGDRAIVLNWSERKRWWPSLATIAFHYFGGAKEFLPLAVVVRPFRRTRVFRFWQAFRQWKHGKAANLERVQADLFRALGS